MPQDDKYLGILKKYWGYSEFRGIQREIIESIGAGKDTLGLMPTGGGKSITFQVPAIAQEGVCIVVTPVSYTQPTLPTLDSVYISVGAS